MERISGANTLPEAGLNMSLPTCRIEQMLVVMEIDQSVNRLLETQHPVDLPSGVGFKNVSISTVAELQESEDFPH